VGEQVLPGVFRIKIRMGYVNAYLIAADGLTLIDSGLTGQAGTIEKAIVAAGHSPSDLQNILITHHHSDHTGSLAALVKKTGAKAYVHPLDAPITRGDAPVSRPNPKVRLGRILGPLIMRLQPSRLPAVNIEREVTDGDVLTIAGGINVVHTPGHTAGHISYLWPRNSGILFAGDAAANFMGLGPPVGAGGMFTEDHEQAKESFRKLAALEFDAACFGHGGPITGKAHADFRRAVEKMAR
jgi:glyoxylase-like metal-dependent hydrolase (beta-lactamase superfamily II)